MSHWAKVTLQVKNLALFGKACDRHRLKLIPVTNLQGVIEPDYAIFSNTGRRIAELRRTRQSDEFDLWMESDYQRITGESPNALTKDYMEEIIRYEAERNSWSVYDRQELQDGSILLELVVNS